MKAKILIVAAMALLPFAANAQTNINKVWEQVVKGSIGTQNAVEMEHDNDAEGKTWTFDHYGLLVKSGSPELKRLEEAFKSDRKEAYSVYAKSAGQTGRVVNTTKIGYADGTKALEFGYDNSHNYEVLLFHDKNDEMRRTAYALVWFETGRGNTQCHVYRFYGLDPRKANTKKNQTTTIQSDGTVVKYDGNTNNSVVMRPQANSIDSVNVKNSADFIVCFNTLRTEYTKAINFADGDQAFWADKIMQPVNQIVILCQKYHSLLSTKEQTSCANILADMQKQSHDKGVTEMLELARKYLLNM